MLQRAGAEFVRRSLTHVLPSGFVKIRHYGIFANGRADRRETARALLSVTESPPGVPPVDATASTDRDKPEWQVLFERLTGTRLTLCRRFGTGIIARHPLPNLSGGARGPPETTTGPPAAAGS